MPLLLRTDQFTPTKRPNCTHGEPCGGACIDPRETCHAELSPEMRARVEGLKNNLLNTIPGYKQLSSARAAVADFKRVRQAGGAGQQAMYLGALLVGTSVLAYSKYREKYREGFNNSAEVALRRSKGMANSVPDIGGKQNVIFTVDSSLSKGDKGRGGGLAEELMTDPGFAAKYHIASIKQNAHETPKDMESLSPRDRRIAEAMVPIKQAVMNARNGQSDAAVELASQMLAYHNKYSVVTTRQEKNQYGSYVNVRSESLLGINVLGHGDGGMVASEAMEILKRVPGGAELAGRINVVGLNTPDAGLTDTVGKVKTIASRNSPVSLLPMKNKVTMNAPDSEGGRAMLRKKEVREFIDGHFGGVAAIPKAAPAAPSVSTTPTTPATPGKPVTQAPSTPPATPAPRPATPAQSTFSQSTGVAKTSTLGGDTSEAERLAISRTRMVGFANRLQTASMSESSVAELRKQYPEVTDKEVDQAIKIRNAPNVIKQMLRTGEIQPAPAARIAELMKMGKDKGDFEDMLDEEMETRSFDFNKPQDVEYLLEQFRSYKARFRKDSLQSRVHQLKKRINALRAA